MDIERELTTVRLPREDSWKLGVIANNNKLTKTEQLSQWIATEYAKLFPALPAEVTLSEETK